MIQIDGDRFLIDGVVITMDEVAKSNHHIANGLQVGLRFVEKLANDKAKDLSNQPQSDLQAKQKAAAEARLARGRQ